MHFDVFNGDADGICALHQLRLAEPRPDARLVTGVKRDVKLVDRIIEQAEDGDQVTVLDISLDSNRKSLFTILDKGCSVFYADHHYAGALPENLNFLSHIDDNPEVCTSLIIDRFLDGQYRSWAVAGAFGDNLHDSARVAAETLDLAERDLAVLRELGELLNYNGYGPSIEALHFPPQDLYEAVRSYASPFDFFHDSEVLAALRHGFHADMENALIQKPYLENESGRVYMFPAESWSKRAAGVFANEKAREMPNRAHGLIVDNGNGTFLVSVRAPLENKKGADKLCLAFPTGGGRAGAAGINALPAEMLDSFLSQFKEAFLS